jgi:predicted O-linked N-acetylglucosamine transferase (SPINDLY family)
MKLHKEIKLKKKLMTLAYSGQYKESEKIAKQILKYKPKDIEVWFALAQIQQSLGNQKAAIFSFMQSTTSPSSHTIKALDQATNICIQNKFFEEGLKASEQWTKIDPRNAIALYRMGICLTQLKQPIQGQRVLEEAHSLAPDDKNIHITLAQLMAVNGDNERALEEFDKGQLFKISFKQYARYLEFLNYCEEGSRESIIERYKMFGRELEAEIKTLTAPDIKDNNTIIKLAYLSPDFRTHSVAHFLKPIFESHNKEKFKIYAYSDTTAQCEDNQFFRHHADEWRDCTELSDESLAKLIKADEIDILIDLASYAAINCRMRVFAMRPAPIQVNYLGFPNTSGLSRMDYRIVDSVTDPEGLADKLSTEQLIRFSPSFLCYSYYGDSSEKVAPLPALSNGFITFGSFNNGQKISHNLLRMWSEILAGVPNSKLLIKNRIFVDEHIKIEYTKKCKEAGIDTNRLILMGFTENQSSHLEIYNDVDIHLDTYPYSGTTTTFEALWMGVASVTLQGEQHRSRVTASILSVLGLNRFISESKEAYCKNAIKLAQDLDYLAKLRSSLRSQLEQSLLMDKVTFTQQLERFFVAAYESYPKKITRF